MLIKCFIYIYQLKITYKKLLKLAAALQLLLHKKDGLTSREKKNNEKQNKIKHNQQQKKTEEMGDCLVNLVA